ncbi:MAG: hypothetical protein RLZZ245_3680 [Verrucomicrobiota bacterium]
MVMKEAPSLAPDAMNEDVVFLKKEPDPKIMEVKEVGDCG